MEPIDAFHDTEQRARRLLKMHDGLINVRKRGIRSDWKDGFCRLMRWPISSAIERVDSKDAVIVLRNDADLVPEDFETDALEDLLRSAITFGVSAVDRYVHERVIKGFVTSFRAGTLTKQQRDFDLPATLAIDIVDKVHVANRNGQIIRPANEIRKVVQETLHKRPFQSWREIEYGFCLIGYKNLGKSLKQTHRLDQSQLERIQGQLGKIVNRRNQIVHEGDLPRHQRGGEAYVQDIRRGWVEESLDFLAAFVQKLEAV